MPLTHRGREVLGRMPATRPRRASSIGCEIVRHEELCVGCGRCARDCPSGASRRGDTFDVRQLLDAPAGSRRGALGAALRRIARRDPAGPIEVPPRVTVFRTIVFDAARCLGCGACARNCAADAIEAVAPEVTAPRAQADPHGQGAPRRQGDARFPEVAP